MDDKWYGLRYRIDKWYGLRCRIALAKELKISPDELLVDPVLEMAECSVFQGSGDEIVAKLTPETKEQESAIVNRYYGEVVGRLFEGSHPFQGFMESVMTKRGII